MLQRYRLKRILHSLTDSGLFTFALGIGLIALFVGHQTPKLSTEDFSEAWVQTITATAEGEAVYVVFNNGPQPDGLYRSQDNGQSWEYLSDKPGAYFNVLAVDPTDETTLYGGTVGASAVIAHSLWRSEDSGQTWQELLLDLPTDPEGYLPTITTLTIDPQQPEILYVGTEGRGLYRFNTETDGYGYTAMGGVSAYNADIKQATVSNDSQLYVLTRDGLFIVTEDNWQKLDTVPEIPISLAISPSDRDILYIGGPSSGVYRSTDAGQTWQWIGGEWWTIPGAALRGTALTVDVQDAKHVIAATAYQVGDEMVGGNIYETYNAGLTWVKVAEANGVIDHLVLNDEAIYAIGSNGLARYGDFIPAATANLER